MLRGMRITHISCVLSIPAMRMVACWGGLDKLSSQGSGASDGPWASRNDHSLLHSMHL